MGEVSNDADVYWLILTQIKPKAMDNNEKGSMEVGRT
jgi:hypothetical protein